MGDSDVSEQMEGKEHKLRALLDVLIEQNEDITLLCSIIEYLKGHKIDRLDEQDIKKYTDKIIELKLRQRDRYETIDSKINENILDIKNEKTKESYILENGKEVRKLENGVRTLILFTGDVVKMLQKGSTVLDRVDDRIYYFDKRSAALESEIHKLQQKIAAL